MVIVRNMYGILQGSTLNKIHGRICMPLMAIQIQTQIRVPIARTEIIKHVPVRYSHNIYIL
jgi:hypothetical protein